MPFKPIIKKILHKNQILSQKLNHIQQMLNNITTQYKTLSDTIDSNTASLNNQISALIAPTQPYSPRTALWKEATINLSSNNLSGGPLIVGPLAISTTTSHQLCSISNLMESNYASPCSIYISSDNGKSWNYIQNSYVDDHYIYGLAVSGNGAYMTYNVTGNITYCSTNYGQTWTTVPAPSTIVNQPSSKPITTSILTNPQNWIAISNNGQYQTAVSIANSLIYVSRDSSLTWNLHYDTILTETGGFSCVAMTGSGETQIISSYFYYAEPTNIRGGYFIPGGSLYISKNYGIISSWSRITSTSFDLTNQIWISIAINSSPNSTQNITAGQYITALSLGTSTTHYPLSKNSDPLFMLESGSGYMYTSSDSGNTWRQVSKIGKQFWESISMSSTGQYQTAVTQNGLVYTSSDYGSTWALNNNISVNSSNTGLLPNGSNPFNVCLSSNGHNQSLSNYWVSNNSTISSGSIYYSNNST